MTAISLRVLQIWQEEGASKYHYAPVMNYRGEANKYINNHGNPSGRTLDQYGNNYYTSHPPFAFILPYFCFQAFNIEATVLSLQLFNLFIGILSCLLLFEIAMIVFARNRKIALISTAFYAFSPTVLWFQGNTYMSDILVHFFFLLQVLMYLKLLQRFTNTRMALLFLVSFLMVYTSWLGVLSTIVMLGILFFNNRGKVRWSFVLLGVLTISSALLLTLVQYAQINGWESIWKHFTYRFQVRGSNSIENEGGLLKTKALEIATILFNYSVNYGLLTLISLYFIVRQRKKAFQANRFLKPLFLLALVPIILLNLLLLNYCGQDFTTLYASLFLSIVGAVCIIEFSPKIQKMLLLTVLISNVGLYYFINRPGESSWKGDRYDEHVQLAEKIRRTVSENQVAVIFGDDIDPMTLVYAKRNVLVVSDSLELQQKLELIPAKEYQVIEP